MDLETMIHQLPPYIESDGIRGLTIQYKPAKNVWACSYGKIRTPSLDNEKQLKYIGVGQTPFEAVEDLIIKIKTWNKTMVG
jgi:hypothetical protein